MSLRYFLFPNDFPDDVFLAFFRSASRSLNAFSSMPDDVEEAEALTSGTKNAFGRGGGSVPFANASSTAKKYSTNSWEKI